MTMDKTQYNQDADDIAKKWKVHKRTVLNWVKKGYPLPNGRKVAFEGYVRIGRSIRFNSNVITNFIERVNNESWESLEEVTKQRKVSKRVRIGMPNSISKTNDFVKQLELLTSRKH